ncbi:endonuclease/exonuclease/phosphatase family protein [Candidatus Saccharibacteria bacterium]|nr:endonuclease/exonuclease/phosphatase family protein [Candidatus Saccharibacteria bacterium]
MKFKTIQWNIGGALIRDPHSDKTLDGSYNVDGLDYIVQKLKSVQPDIITLQEIHLNDHDNQAAEIARKLGGEYHFVSGKFSNSHLKPDQFLGMAILSRHPIKNSRTAKFPNPQLVIQRPNGELWRTHDKGVIIGEIDLTGEIIEVMSTQAVPLHRFFVDMTTSMGQAMCAKIQRVLLPKLPKYLIQGDFNIDSPSLKDFFPGIVNGGHEIIQDTPTGVWGRRNDHILYGGLKLLSSRVDDQVLTDHYPIISEFEI